MKTNYKLEYQGSWVKILINNTVHLKFKSQEYLGFQSWQKSKNWYKIEIYTTNKDILLVYDSIDKWREIIKLLDTIH